MTSPSVTTIPSGRPAWSRAARIGDYDGAIDKEDCQTETIPYAWVWYQEIEGGLGTAFTTATTGEVHSRKLALARLQCAIQRAAEKIDTNASPVTADDLLGEWVSLLQLHLKGTESRQEIRQRAGAKFASAKGGTQPNVDAACQQLLGSAFVANTRTVGVNLATEPPATRWPGGIPGSPADSIGGPAWLSERAHLAVSVTQPSSVNDGDFFELVNVELFNELDRLLPAWMTFNWSVGSSSTGFLLDISHLDFQGLT
jgi:hypothetical protein